MWLFGLQATKEAMLNASTLEEQERLYRASFRSYMLWLLWIFDNPLMLWLLNGVPQRQLAMIRENGRTVKQYCTRVFDQVVKTYLLKNDNYFYRLCLTGKYTKECCPSYLKVNICI
jgi:betaine lipid synthase